MRRWASFSNQSFINRMKKEPSVFGAGFSAFPPLFGLGQSVFSKSRHRALPTKHSAQGLVVGHKKLPAACPNTAKSARELYFDYKLWPASKKYVTYKTLRDMFGLKTMQIINATSASRKQNKQYFGVKSDTPSINKAHRARNATIGRPMYYRLPVEQV